MDTKNLETLEYFEKALKDRGVPFKYPINTPQNAYGIIQFNKPSGIYSFVPVLNNGKMVFQVSTKRREIVKDEFYFKACNEAAEVFHILGIYTTQEDIEKRASHLRKHLKFYR